MLRSTTVLFIAELATAIAPVHAATRFPVGTYVRFTQSPSFPLDGRETGTLRIVEASRNVVRFQLEAAVNPRSDNDESLSRNGVIENGEFHIKGRSATYRSTNPEDKELGTCVLNLQRSGQVIVVAQSGKCWWFGEGVNASGEYRPAREGEVHVVR
ncbi:hypothetical protein [Polaromonas sp. P5_D5]